MTTKQVAEISKLRGIQRMNIVFLCILMGNPYAELLAHSLTPLGVKTEIEEHNFSYLFLSQVLGFKDTKILHLHTIHYFFLGSNFIHRWVKFFIFVIQILILKLIGIKIVWTVHEWADRFGGKNRIYPVWSTILGKLFNAVITHCETTKADIVKAFHLKHENQVFVIPHGNYIGAYKNYLTQAEARKLLGIADRDQVFLLFGGIHRTKGFLEAIDVFKKLDPKNVSLLIVGQPAEDQMEEEIKSKISACPNIIFIPGKVADDDIQLYMNACDCLMVPYKVSTTSGVTILGMSFGKACIAPKTGFFSDVLDDQGAFLYELDDPDGLLNAVKRSIENVEQLSAMGQHNLYIAEQWDWQIVGQQTFESYRYCLKP